jgi:hypothetical protein
VFGWLYSVNDAKEFLDCEDTEHRFDGDGRIEMMAVKNWD